MLRRLPVLFAVALTVLPAVAMAQPYGFAPNGQDLVQRLENQRQRIAEGARRGQLTRGEVEFLRRNETRIRFELRRALADGYVSPREHGYVSRLLDDQDRRIYAQRRDYDRRYPGRYY